MFHKDRYFTYACPFMDSCVMHPYPYGYIQRAEPSFNEARSDVTNQPPPLVYESYESNMLPFNTKEKKRPHP